MASIKARIAPALDLCAQSILSGKEMDFDILGKTGILLFNECKRRKIDPKHYLQSERERTPGAIINDSIKMGLAPPKTVEFQKKYSFVIDLEYSIGMLSHYMGSELAVFKKSLAGKSLKEKSELFERFPGMANRLVELAQLESQQSKLFYERRKKAIGWYKKREKNIPQKERNELYDSMTRGKNLTPREKREFEKLEKAEQKIAKIQNKLEKETRAAVQNYFQIAFKKPIPLAQIREAQRDESLGKRQKDFFYRAEQAMKTHRKI